MSKGVRIVILCEDQLHASFARQLLQARGYSRHEIRVMVSPGGQGAGEQFVREKLSGEVQAMRWRRSHQQVALLTITDADTQSVSTRVQSLESAMMAGGQAPRTKTEPLAFLIPRRNIETWLLHLGGEEVDEELDYKQHWRGDRSCRQEARAMAQGCASGFTTLPPLPSMQHACAELCRLS